MEETKHEAWNFRQVQLLLVVLFEFLRQRVMNLHDRKRFFKLVAKCREALNATSPFMVWWARQLQASLSSTHTHAIWCETTDCPLIKLKIWKSATMRRRSHRCIYRYALYIEVTIACKVERCLRSPGWETCICALREGNSISEVKCWKI